VKDVELKLVSELVKNSRRSDRELAKAIGVSQPTISRMIKKLENQGIITQYSMMPDLNKLGFEIMALTFAAYSPETLKEYPEKARIEKRDKFISRHHNIVFASAGRGLGMTRMILSVHRSYSDYSEYMKQFEDEWAGLFAKVESFTISLKTDTALTVFSLRNLAEYISKMR
jgi:DNA-binding Lrp family transcriptional regulator